MVTPFDQAPEKAKPNATKALIVDDDESLRQVASLLLEAIGFDVIVAVDGEDAIRQFKTHGDEFALVLMDIHMPRLGGLDAIKLIHAINPSMTVILSSGEWEYSPERLSSSNASAFLRKPYTFGELRLTVQGLLPRHNCEQLQPSGSR